jgi:hypothetical protein
MILASSQKYVGSLINTNYFYISFIYNLTQFINHSLD